MAVWELATTWLLAEAVQVKAVLDRFQQLGLDLTDPVVHRQGACVAGLATRLRRTQAEHADGVAAAVCMRNSQALR